MPDEKDQFSDSEIAARMNAAIRRAMNTPPSPTKELVGKTERAQSQRESRGIRRRKNDPASD